MDFYRFDFKFDTIALINDLNICQEFNWPLHFNQNDYTGSWSSFSLRSISGDEFDIVATANAKYQDTPTLKKCSYFREVIDFFECPKEAVRLLSLSPQSYIKEHRDDSAGYRDGFFRIHVPIQTNPKVVFKLNGNTLPMQVGECWYADFNLPHYVANDGENDRIHLVLDCIRNDWSDKLFASIGYDFENEFKPNYDIETKKMMIEQLSLIDTEVSRSLIEQLKAELAAQ